MSTAMRVLDWLNLIRLIKLWLRQASEILDLPDLDDPSEVYGWCRSVLTLARESAELTPVEVDDLIVAWLLDGPFATFESFQPFYEIFRIILELIDGDESHESIAAEAMKAVADQASLRARLSANPLGLDPVALIAIIVQIIRLIIELKRN